MTKITTSPAEADAKAKLSTGVVASDNAILYTAKEAGVAGNAITVTHVDPPGNDAALDVTVSGTDITVSLATDGASAVTSKADAVVDAVNADAEANLLVAASSAVGDSNGTGTVAALAKTNLAGGKASKVSRVETDSVITDPEDEKAVRIPSEADATGRDELRVHENPSPLEAIADF